MKTRKTVFAIVAAAIFVVVVYIFTMWMQDLYEDAFIIDVANPGQQVNGITYTLTLILVLFYIVSGAYLIMEAKVSEIEIQKKFYIGLAILFVFISLAQFVVLIYSILDDSYPVIMQAVMPDLALGRGDINYALAFASFSSPIIMHHIEKYIRSSKKFVITKIIGIGAIAGIGAIISAYFQGNIPGLEDEDVWVYFTYLLTALMAMDVIITLLALPIIYGSLAKQTSGDLKKNAVTIAFGYVLTFSMVLLHLLRDQFGAEIPYGWMIFLAGNIIGSFILFVGYLRSTF